MMVSKLGDNKLDGCDIRRLIPTGKFLTFFDFLSVFSLGQIQIPCHITYVPKNEQACQLTARLARLVEIVEPACESWQADFLTNQIRLLRESELPEDENPGCPPIGEPMTNLIRQKAQK